MPYQLAAIDLDDTLLGPDKAIGAENAQAVRTLLSFGLDVVLASGRRHENMIRFHRRLDLAGPIVSCNGALVKVAESGEVLAETLVPASLADEIVVLGDARGATQNYYHTDGSLYVRERSRWTELYQSRTGSEVSPVGDLTQFHGASVLKIIWIDAPETIARWHDEIAPRFADRLYVTTTDPEYLEFMAPGVSKAAGVGVVAERNHITRDEVIAFGDGNNDVPLLRWAGLGVAVGHARPGARDAADVVGPSGNPETAFARAVEALIASGQLTQR